MRGTLGDSDTPDCDIEETTASEQPELTLILHQKVSSSNKKLKYDLEKETGMTKTLLGAVIVITMASAALAADVTGTWKASFDTQVGVQNYTYTFKVEGNKLTGKAKSELANVETEIAEGTVNGDDVSFVENITFMDMPLRIVYKGKIMGDEIKFTRTILDMFMEEAVAKRQK